MTPKSKSEELYNYYVELIKDFTKGVSVHELAKLCALKNAQEILESDHNTLTLGHTGLAFWQQVALELIKL